MRIFLQFFFVGKDTVLHQQIVTSDRFAYFCDIISMIYASGRDNGSISRTKSFYFIGIRSIVGIKRIPKVFGEIFLRCQGYFPTTVIYFSNIHQGSAVSGQMRNRYVQQHIRSVGIIIIHSQSQQSFEHLQINTHIHHRILFPTQIFILYGTWLITIHQLSVTCAKHIIIQRHQRQMIIITNLEVTGHSITRS